jgi:hypothetical protein
VKPEQLLDPETLPDDLRWLATEFKLQPKDPVFVLIAWHWHRVQQAEDTLHQAQLELQTAVDARIDSLAASADTIASLAEMLEQVQAALEKKPALVAAQLDAELKVPLAKLQTLGKSLDALVRSTQAVATTALHRQILAALLTGVALGITSAAILFLA